MDSGRCKSLRSRSWSWILFGSSTYSREAIDIASIVWNQWYFWAYFSWIMDRHHWNFKNDIFVATNVEVLGRHIRSIWIKYSNSIDYFWYHLSKLDKYFVQRAFSVYRINITVSSLLDLLRLLPSKRRWFSMHLRNLHRRSNTCEIRIMLTMSWIQPRRWLKKRMYPRELPWVFFILGNRWVVFGLRLIYSLIIC